MASIVRRLVKGVGLPVLMTAQSWRHSGPLRPMRHFRMLERLARSAPAVWQRYRDEQLRALLSHALDQIPLYAGLRDELASVVQDDPMEALRGFPVLVKADQQERRGELIARDASRRRMTERFTTGSVGQPVKFWHDRRRDMMRWLGGLRDEGSCGWRPGDGMGMIWHYGSPPLWARSRFWSAVSGLAGRRALLDLYDLAPDTTTEFLDRLERLRPATLRCYASAADEFARLIQEAGLADRARALKLRGIVSSCETLFPHQRQRIECVFGCRVFNLYATREAFVVAAECTAHNGLHVSADGVVVEILDDAGERVEQGETGRIVVTDLWNMGYGIIRWDLGDEGSYLPDDGASCPCGVTFPRLAGVAGRVTDYFEMPDGARFHGQRFIHMMWGRPGVRQFQVVQEARTRFTLRIVGDGPELKAQLPQMLGYFPAGAEVDVRFCDEIPLGPGGKRRFLISKVAGWSPPRTNNEDRPT